MMIDWSIQNKMNNWITMSILSTNRWQWWWWWWLWWDLNLRVFWFYWGQTIFFHSFFQMIVEKPSEFFEFNCFSFEFFHGTCRRVCNTFIITFYSYFIFCWKIQKKKIFFLYIQQKKKEYLRIFFLDKKKSYNLLSSQLHVFPIITITLSILIRLNNFNFHHSYIDS